MPEEKICDYIGYQCRTFQELSYHRISFMGFFKGRRKKDEISDFFDSQLVARKTSKFLGSFPDSSVFSFMDFRNCEISGIIWLISQKNYSMHSQNMQKS